MSINDKEKKKLQRAILIIACEVAIICKKMIFHILLMEEPRLVQYGTMDLFHGMMILILALKEKIMKNLLRHVIKI